MLTRIALMPAATLPLVLAASCTPPHPLNPRPDTAAVVATVSPSPLSAATATVSAREPSQTDGPDAPKHRGERLSQGLERWRPALENYAEAVRHDNQTPVNAVAVPFAKYLSKMHERIHPIFADQFLASLDALPSTDAINNMQNYTTIEVVLAADDGRLLRVGVVHSSGVTAFDIGVLDSIHRASPFGKTPNAIRSFDGNVYIHWQFHRNPLLSCTTVNTRPFLLSRPSP